MKKICATVIIGGGAFFLIGKEGIHPILIEFVGLIAMMGGAITLLFLSFTSVDGKWVRHRRFSKIPGSTPLIFVETITKFDGSVVVVARMLWDKKRAYGEEGKLCIVEGVPGETWRKLKPGDGF